MRDFLLFTIEERRFAVELKAILRVVRMVEVTPLPDAPDSIAGVISFHGDIVPVLALRRRCGLPPRSPLPSDQLIIAAAGDRTVALPVDVADEIVSLAEEDLLPLDRLFPGGGDGVVNLAGDIVLLCDFDRLIPPGVLLSAQEAADDAPL